MIIHVVGVELTPVEINNEINNALQKLIGYLYNIYIFSFFLLNSFNKIQYENAVAEKYYILEMNFFESIFQIWQPFSCSKNPFFLENSRKFEHFLQEFLNFIEKLF